MMKAMDIPNDVLQQLFNVDDIPNRQRPTVEMLNDLSTALKNAVGRVLRVNREKITARTNILNIINGKGKPGQKMRNEIREATAPFIKQWGEEVKSRVAELDVLEADYAKQTTSYVSELEIAKAQRDKRLKEQIDKIQNIQDPMRELLTAIGNDKLPGKIGYAYNIMTGVFDAPSKDPMSLGTARIAGSTRAMANLSKLGSAVITNIADMTNVIGVGTRKGHGNEFQMFVQVMKAAMNNRIDKADPIEATYRLFGARGGIVSNRQLTEAYDQVGVAMEGVSAAMLQDNLDDSMSVIAPWMTNSLSFMNASTMLTRLNSNMKRASAMSVHEKVGRVRRKTFDQLDTLYKAELKSLDIDSLDWDVLRSLTTEIDGIGGPTHYMDMEKLRMITDDPVDILEAIGKDNFTQLQLRTDDAGQFFTDLRRKYHALVSEMVYTASLTPDKFDKAWIISPYTANVAAKAGLGSVFREIPTGLYSGGAGSPAREILHTAFFQLKTYTMAYMNKVARMNNPWGAGRSVGAGNNARLLLSSSALNLTVGYAVTAMKAVAMGYSPPELFDDEGNLNMSTVGRAYSVSVGLAALTDVAIQYIQTGGDQQELTQGIFAPFLSDTLDMSAFAIRAIGADTDEKRNKSTVKAIKQFYRGLPFNNYLYSRAITDLGFYSLIADPIDGGESRENRNAFMKETYGQVPLLDGLEP